MVEKLHPRTKDLTGQQFGRLKVIEFAGYKKRKRQYRRDATWKCLCECGNEKTVVAYHLKSGRTKSCGCLNIQITKSNSGCNSSNWKGIGEIPGRKISKIKREALRRGLEYSIRDEYLYNLFLKQNKKCNLTGIPLVFDSNGRTSDGNASLDRINNLEGYIEGNVQWVLKDINMIKQSFLQDYFIELCKKVVEYNA